MGSYKDNLNNQRERFKRVFQDTMDFIKENPILASMTENSKTQTEYYFQDDMYGGPALKDRFLNNVFITKSKTLEAALRQHKQNPSNKIAILNFASATNPGGGVVNGSSAQEESICRCTNLYPCLNTKENFI